MIVVVVVVFLYLFHYVLVHHWCHRFCDYYYSVVDHHMMLLCMYDVKHQVVYIVEWMLELKRETNIT